MSDSPAPQAQTAGQPPNRQASIAPADPAEPPRNMPVM